MTHNILTRASLLAALGIVASAPVLAAQQTCPATTPGATMPLAYQGGPTVPAITACDLMTRLYVYAADSMRGREAGTPDAIRATAYIEREARKIGLLPAGDNGTFFQYMPVTARALSQASAINAGGRLFRPGVDFSAAGAADRSVTGDVFFGGTLGDTANALAAEDVRGKIVLVMASAGGGGRGGFGGGRGGAANNPLAGAAAIVTIVPQLPRARLQYVLNDTVQNEGRTAFAAANPAAANAAGRGGRGGAAGGASAAPLTITVTPVVASAMLGKPVAGAVRGDKGGSVTIDLKVENLPQPTRSVVGLLPGTDPTLKNQYIVIGAHSDHIGMAGAAVEHDSLKAYNMVARVEGADSRGGAAPTPEQWTRINVVKDSLRRVRPARLDSISNGADDDGSGSVSILEIAEAFAKGGVKPKRSLLFIWQTGEEKGLWGSQWFTNHPTVPRDSIIADLNLDMVGRGAAADVTGQDKDNHELFGAENYLQLVGSRRLSTELGDIVEQVSAREPLPFRFDYAMDANGHPQNIYCRSDHANYARYGIPVVFFTTGGHADYHQVTDEPEYIQYEHMARVDKLVFDIALKIGDMDHRVAVDKGKPDSPFGRCQQ